MPTHKKPSTHEYKPNIIAGSVYSNRYNAKWSIRKIKENTYSLDHEDLTYCRFGGKEGNFGILHEDLGFVDPSGGPFLAVEGFTINGKLVTKIYCEGTDILFNTENFICDKEGE